MAHPRSRGENAKSWRAGIATSGSSPLTRGKHLEQLAAAGVRGLIPAHAGKTGVPSFFPKEDWAHPRSRGENSSMLPRRSPNSGSSPLTRGKHENARLAVLGFGLIPAHAGKTSRMSVAACSAQAHPRSRGENVLASWRLGLCLGSSPLTRGKLHPVEHTADIDGLIPAHAGKTSPRP